MLRNVILGIGVLLALGCTKESKSKSDSLPASGVACTWQVMETYPEQVRGDCQLDTSKDSLEIKLYDVDPALDTLMVEIDNKVLEPQHFQYDATKNMLIIKDLAEDMRNGNMRISYTANRPSIGE